MTVRNSLARIFQQEDLNFLLTNRIPRHAATRFVGWLSRVENPLVRDLCMGIWTLFSDLDLSEAKQTQFRSMHDCFTRELKEGARPVAMDPDIVVSPCDAIVGSFGPIEGTRLYQIKGFPYTLEDLLGDPAATATHADGQYITLRLTSDMYHRFHAPHDCRVEQVDYIAGDTWNVNPIALKRIERLFCKNERAVIHARLAGGQPLTLVPVAAILVASLRLHCLDRPLNLAHRGTNRFQCSAVYKKGQEMGWFEHGSTIVLLAPRDFSFERHIHEGARIRMGEPLMRMPDEH